MRAASASREFAHDVAAGEVEQTAAVGQSNVGAAQGTGTRERREETNAGGSRVKTTGGNAGDRCYACQRRRDEGTRGTAFARAAAGEEQLRAH